jgi:spore germination protein GerM
MKKRSILLVLLCAVLAFSFFGLTGCGGKSSDTGDTNGTTEPAEQNYRVTLFFANEDYIATGDESLEKFMVYETEMTAKPADAYKKALELLKTPPEEEGYGTVLKDQITFNDVYMKDDTAYVDISSSGLNGGSLEETFLISQIVDTLMNSFKEIKQVQFLVDGKTAETLMGHIGTVDPFTKDLFTE